MPGNHGALAPKIRSFAKVKSVAVKVRAVIPPKQSAAAAAAASVQSPTPAPAPAAVAPVSGGVNVRDYGAKGDGKTDDQKSIDQTCAAAAKASHVVNFPAGTYLHSDVINVPSGVSFTGAGSASIIAASNSAKGKIAFTGDRVSISKLVVTYLSAPVPDHTQYFSGDGIWF